METRLRVILALCVFILFVPYAESQGFNELSVFRGHTNDDVYVYCKSKAEEYHLYYFTENGAKIHPKLNANNESVNYIAETTLGKIVCQNQNSILVSNDYGDSFTVIAPFPAPSGSLYRDEGFMGGAFPGEYYVFCHTLYPTSRNYLYLTKNTFATTTSVFRPDENPYGFDVGLLPGELLLYSWYTEGYHSLDYGHTFDTLSFSHGPFKRGTKPGEIYKTYPDIDYITGDTVGIVYHSNDNGVVMEEIGRKKMSNLTLDYTPGRDSCAFYIAEVIPGSGSDYNTLNLHVSTDCCQTFTTYSYLLSPDVGLKDNEVDKGGLSVSPNPASQWVSIGYTLKHSGKAAIAIFTSDGIKADGFETNYQSAGSRTLTYDCTKLKPGFYTIVLTSTDGLMKSGKMVISR